MNENYPGIAAKLMTGWSSSSPLVFTCLCCDTVFVDTQGMCGRLAWSLTFVWESHTVSFSIMLVSLMLAPSLQSNEFRLL